MPFEFPVSLIIKAIDKVTAPLQKINAQVQKITEPVKRVNNAFHSLSIEAGFDKLADRTKRLGSALGKVKDEAQELAKRLGTWGLLAGGAVFGLAKSTAEAGDSIAKVAAKLGIGTQKLQEWRFAAKQSGVEQDILDQSLQRLSINLAQAALGSGETSDIFKALSVSVRDAKGHVRSLESVLPVLADKFSNIKNASVKNAIALKLFGKEGVDLSAWLQRGSKGFLDGAKEAHALGAVLSGDTIQAALRFKDTWDQLKITFVGVRNAVGSLLLPVVSDLVQKLQKFLVENREKIIAWAKAFIARLPEAFRQAKAAFLSFKQALTPVVVLIKMIVALLGGIQGVAIIVASIISGKLVLAILSLVNAFRAFTLVLIANPVLLAISVIVAALFLLVVHWKTVKAAFIWVWESMKQAVQTGVEFIKTTVERVFTGIKNFLEALNPFAAIHKGIEKTHDSLEKLQPSKGFALPKASGNTFWEPAWGASHTIRNIHDMRAQRSQASIKVTFDNAPPGTRVITQQRANSGIDLDTSLGLQMAN